MARTAFFGLYALQHRGQESAGIATSDGQSAYSHKRLGLVSRIFDEDTLAKLKGHMAIGHTRYSTTGASHIRNAQPFLVETQHGPLGVAHNGNLTNAGILRSQLLGRGIGMYTSTDSEVIALMMASPLSVMKKGSDWLDRIVSFMEIAQGAYSLGKYL